MKQNRIPHNGIMRHANTVRKARILKDNSPFSYIGYPHDSDTTVKLLSELSWQVLNDIMPIYPIELCQYYDLGPDNFKSINVDNELFRMSDDNYSKISENSYSAIKSIESILEKNNSTSPVLMRFDSGSNQLLVLIHPDGRNMLVDDKQNALLTIVLIQGNLVTTYLIRLMHKNAISALDPFTDRAFYIGKKDRIIEDAIEYERIKSKTLYANILSMACKGLSIYLENMDKRGDEIKLSSMEMYMNKKCSISAGYNISGPLSQVTPIDELIDRRFVDYSKLFKIDNFDGKNAAKAMQIIRDESADYTIEYPLVDFSAKEMKFVEKYADKKYDNGDIVDLRQYLEHFPYGNGFRLRLNYDREVLVTWILSKTDEAAILYIMDKDDKYHMPVITVDLANISEFNYSVGFSNNIPGFHIDLYQDINQLTTDLRELGMLEYFTDKESCVGLVCKILDIIVIINERPQRSRMVRISDTNPVSHNKNVSTNKKNKSSGIIISRVLKPINEAKAYVEKMQAESGSGERNYILESWPRRGHWRKLHNSDKKVWIEATTCSRHEELVTEKEVIVKL